MVADLEQVDKNRRVRIPQRKARREGDDLAQFGDNSKNRRWTKKIIGGDQVLRTPTFDKVPSKFEEKFKKTFLENQTGFHHRPKQEVIAHQQSLQRSTISSPKLLRKIFGTTCHEFVQQADLRRLFQVKPVAIVVPVYRRPFARQARLVHHLQHHYRRKVQAQHRFQH